MLKPFPTTCPVCGARGEETFRFVMDYRSPDGEFSLFECRSCSVQFWEPFVEPDAEWYAKAPWYVGASETEEGGAAAPVGGVSTGSWNVEKIVSLLPPGKGKKFLDVGCGTGGMLLRAREKGYAVSGVDFNEHQIALIRERLGISDVVADDVFHFFGSCDTRFDVIVATDVLEHVGRPYEFVRGCLGLLAKGGTLSVSVPNRNRSWGRHHDPWDFPPHHLLRFDAASLRALFRSAGSPSVRVIEQFPNDYFVGKLRTALYRLLPGGAPSDPDNPEMRGTPTPYPALNGFRKFIRAACILPALIALPFGLRGSSLVCVASAR